MIYIDLKIRKNKEKLDYFIFFILIPSFLIIVYSLLLFVPQLKAIFVLQPSNPTLISIYFSNYAHIEFSHFLNDLISYYILIYLIFIFETNRKRLYINMILFFTVLPVLCSLSTVYYLPKLRACLGFSCVVSGLLGYLLYSVYCYIKKEWNVPLNMCFIFLILEFNLLIIVSIYKWVWWCAFLLLLLLVTFYVVKKDLRMVIHKLNDDLRELKKQKNAKVVIPNCIIFSLTVFFLLGGVIGLFPPNVGRINILAHYIGYGSGVLIPLMIVDIVLLKILGKGVWLREESL